MKFNFLIFLLLFSTFEASAQKLKVISWQNFEKKLSQKNDTTYIYNFWATWCKPCVAELPNFEQVHQQYQNKKIKIVLVSLDFEKDKARVEEFLRKRNITSQVVLLNEPDYNRWIDKVDASWSGAIPATLFLNSNKRKRLFFEKELNLEELNSHIRTFLQ